jgi:hypothetical protein
MRVLVAAVAGTVALASWSPVQAQCAQAKEVTAFNIRALQSQLMVAALTCDMTSQYNTFVTRHRSGLDSNRRTLISYFNRAGGGERAFNNYDTELANVQSTLSTRRGSLYCGDIKPVFTEVLQMTSVVDVEKYAVAKELPQPRTVQACGTAQAAARPAAQQRR